MESTLVGLIFFALVVEVAALAGNLFFFVGVTMLLLPLYMLLMSS
jgi:hypothetical protein